MLDPRLQTAAAPESLAHSAAAPRANPFPAHSSPSFGAAHSFGSVKPLGAAQPLAGTGSPSALEAAAEDFEALFLQQVLKQMRKASDALGGEHSFKSREQATLNDFYDGALAQKLAGSGQTGLRHLLVAQLSGQPQNLAAATAAARQAALPQAQIPNAPLPAALNADAAHGRPSLSNDNAFLQLYRSSDASGEALPLAQWRNRARAAVSLAGNRFGEALEKSDFYQLVKRVIAQESAGRSDAVSPKGALGLMQLMPSTAREMASEQGLPYSQERLTRDPHYNVKLGTAYLQKMLARYDHSAPLALAAYNAGPGRVDQWLGAFGDPRTGALSERAWMQAIPIAETRAYTQNILRDFAKTPVRTDVAFKPAVATVALDE